MTVIITGGSGAIGSMCAYYAATLGYNIVLCYNQNQNGAQNVVNMLSDFNIKIKPVCADITTQSGRDAIFNAANELGGADILINNAAASHIGAFLDTCSECASNIINLNLTSQIELTRKIIPQMLKKSGGAIVNISSVWGIKGASCEVEYSASKAGIIGFTKALAKELAPSNITVNCVAPGCIESNMLNGLDKDMLCSMIPLSRIGNGLDVAKAVFALATNDYITGAVLSVDGGMAL